MPSAPASQPEVPRAPDPLAACAAGYRKAAEDLAEVSKKDGVNRNETIAELRALAAGCEAQIAK